MKRIEEIGGKYFLIDKKMEHGELVERSQEITDAEIVEALEEFDSDTTLQDESVYVPCFNPDCKNVIRMTQRQKRDLLLSFQKKYKKVVFVACSPECQNIIKDIFQADSE